MSKSMRVALYARVSTAKCEQCGKLRGEHEKPQHAFKGQDPELQLRELREYALSRGWIITNEYVDIGVSGAKGSRPGLNRLMVDAKQRRVDAVLVWRLDRFGRSVRHLVNALAELEALGVAFVSLRDNLDLSTPSGRLMFQIIGAMAEFERALIQERVRAGLALARSKGKKLGRPRSDLNRSAVLGLRLSGASIRQIARELDSSVGSISRMLGEASVISVQENQSRGMSTQPIRTAIVQKNSVPAQGLGSVGAAGTDRGSV